MTTHDKSAFLRGLPIFKDARDTFFDHLASLLTEVKEEAGKSIFMKGGKDDFMYFLVDGEVKVHDRDHEFAVLKPGDLFGDYFLIDHDCRSATVTTLTEVTILQLAQSTFDDVMASDPSLSIGLLRNLVNRLRKMNKVEEELVELNATKDKFFSLIAHDLRGPLSNIISLSELLHTERETLTDQQIRDFIRKQYDLSWYSIKLLDNLMKWAQLQTGRLEAHPAMFNIFPLLEEVMQFSSSMASGKQISVNLFAPDSLTVFADQDMIRTLTLNLLTNAIKFTPVGGDITITATVENNHMLCSVSDTGVGISPLRMKTLFQPDKMISTDGTEKEKGTGLGLILCKEFVQKNKGTIVVNSELGMGTTISFTLLTAEADWNENPA